MRLTLCESFIISRLFQNEEFYGVIDELVDWLDETERAIKTTEPVDLAEDTVVIVDKFNKFKVHILVLSIDWGINIGKSENGKRLWVIFARSYFA